MKYLFTAITGCALLVFGSMSSGAMAGSYPIVDTNQSLCYDSTSGNTAPCTGKGYDADHQGNQPSYTIIDSTMVKDNITGLTWTRKVDINNDGVVNYSDKMTPTNAVTYCAGLSYGGLTWRLPSIKELYSLMDFTGTDPSSYNGTDTSVLTPFYNTTYFERAFGDTSAGDRIIDAQFVTTSLYVSLLGTMGGNATVFGVNFVDGRIKGYPYMFPANDPKRFYVLCVSGNSAYGTNSFTDNNDQTVTDAATGLMWEKNDFESTNFENAITHCESAASGGYSDWRLPNVKELHSILDYSRAPDATNSAAIDPVFNATSFTNEGGTTDWGYYWSSTTHAAYGGNGSKGAYISFGRALGYYNSTMMDVHGAGAQRSNGKSSITGQGTSSANIGYGTFYYQGPQGDILRLNNKVRCVRNTATALLPTYTIAYNSNGAGGGSVPTNNGTYVEGASVTVAGNTGSLTRTNYTFTGWNTAANGSGTHYAASGSDSFLMGTGNVTLYAEWTGNSYSVSYDGNGNTGGSAPAGGSYGYNSTVTVPANTGSLAKTGYTFTGWNTAANGSGTTYAASGAATFTMGAANVTLYAQWSVNSYSVTYNGNGNTGGSVPAGGSYTYNSTVPVAANTGTLTKTNYVFTGWNTAADGSGTHYAATGAVSFPIGAGDATLYAEWSFNLNLPTPTTSNLGANQVTLLLHSPVTGTGYFTLLSGSGTACGTGTQVKNGQSSTGTAAFRFGSLPLTADVSGSYTVRNLMQSTTYTVCFTADDGVNLQTTPATVNFTTAAGPDLTTSAWETVGDAGFSAGGISNPSLSFAPDGTPYLAYNDSSDGYKATVKKFDGSSWIDVGSSGFSAADAWLFSLSFAPDGTPYVAYDDGGNGDKATVMKYNGTSWVNVGAAGFSTGWVNYPSLSFAPNGTPYVAYADASYNKAAVVRKFDGSSWIDVGTPGISTGNASFTSLAFAPDGTPYLAFKDAVNSNKASVMKFDGSSWVAVGSAGFSAGEVFYLSFSLAPDGTPYVAYQDQGNGVRVTMMKFDGSSWVNVGAAGFSSGQVAWTVTAIGPDGSPYASYTDISNGAKAMVMKYGGASWVNMGSTGFPAGFTYIYSFSFAPDGTPYVAARDGANGNKAMVMKLAPAYTVTYDANGATGGTVPTDSGTYVQGATTTVLANTGSLTRTGYTFTGWNSAADGSGTAYGASGAATFGMGVANVTLYAQWSINNYSVTYDGNGNTGGSVPAGGSHNYNSTVTVAANSGNLARTSYILTGWNTAADGSGTHYAASGAASFVMGAGNVTLYGEWSFNLNLPTPATGNLGANQVTLSLQSAVNGTGYFTLLSGSGTACGTGTQVKNGQTGTGSAAFRFGSLPLTANVAGSYTVRNLIQGSNYTVCFTADDGATVQTTPATVNFTTAAAINLTTSAWTNVGSAGFSTGDAWSTWLAFAPDGTPYVAYNDRSSDLNGKAVVKKYDGATWVDVGSAGLSAANADSTMIAFAPDGTPFLAYTDGGNGYKATVRKYNGATWVDVGSAGFSASSVSSTTLAFAPDGTPYVAYSDGGSDGNATVMKFDGASWVTVGNAGFSAGEASFPSLSIGPDGTPYVAYREQGISGNATVMKFDGASWVNVGPASFSTGEVLFTSLAFAPDGTPYVAYSDLSKDQKATVMKYNGASWTVVGSAGFSSGQASSTSLSFAPDGTPYVAYSDFSAAGKATVMSFDGASWVAAGSAAFSQDQADSTSLSFAPDGTPYLAYRDLGNGYKATVMKLVPAYTVTYDGNGATGGSIPTDSGIYLQGATVTVSANTGSLTKTGYNFAGWNTAADGSGTSYAASGSATFTVGSAHVTLYAKWRNTRVTSVSVPANASYGSGQNLDFTVNWSDSITVTGTDSKLGLTIGSASRSAAYLSKTATSITYRYTVQSGDNDSDGITVGSLTLNTTTIRDSDNFDVSLTLNAVASTAGVLVNTASGDLNSDGNVDISDALRALQIAAGLRTPTDDEKIRGDVAPLVNGRPAPDGKIDIGDVVVLLRRSVGLISF